MKLDDVISPFTSSYRAVLFIILKDRTCYNKKRIRNVSAYQIISFKRPLHYLIKNEDDARTCNGGERNIDTIRIALASEEQKSSLSTETNNISFFLDRFFLRTNFFKIAGWAFISGESSENSNIYLVLQSAKRTYICPTILQNRPDVTAFFNTLNLDNSGFCAIVSTENLEKDIYRIGLYIEKGSYLKAFQFTNGKLIIGNHSFISGQTP